VSQQSDISKEASISNGLITFLLHNRSLTLSDYLTSKESMKSVKGRFELMPELNEAEMQSFNPII
jgi:hypothetical protein